MSGEKKRPQAAGQHGAVEAGGHAQKKARKSPAARRGAADSSGLNKTREIREMARALAETGEAVRPRDVVKALQARKIDVSSPQVSAALKGTGLAVRQKRRYLGRGLQRPPLRFTGPSVSIDDLLKARDYVERIGSVEKAVAALLAYRNFDDQKASQPQPEPTAGSQLDAAV